MLFVMDSSIQMCSIQGACWLDLFFKFMFTIHYINKRYYVVVVLLDVCHRKVEIHQNGFQSIVWL